MFQLLIQECHFSYSPKESKAPQRRSRAKDRSADQHFQKENSLRLECPDANGPGLLRAGPSGEERCTLHHTVPISPQCPQEISLLTLPVFQGAADSSERFSQSLLPRNVAELVLESSDLPSPLGVKAHSSQGMAASKAFPVLQRCRVVYAPTFVRFLTKICEPLLALLFSCHSCALQL